MNAQTQSELGGDVDDQGGVDTEYRCQNCDERISPNLDDLDSGMGKCPHCHHRHPQKVKRWAGGMALFMILSIVLSITIVGLVVAPVTFFAAWYCKRKTNALLEDAEYRVGHEVPVSE